jgi:hypothetical protein
VCVCHMRVLRVKPWKKVENLCRMSQMLLVCSQNCSKMKSVPQYIYYTYYVTMNDNEWDFQNFVPLAIKG